MAWAPDLGDIDHTQIYVTAGICVLDVQKKVLHTCSSCRTCGHWVGKLRHDRRTMYYSS